MAFFVAGIGLAIVLYQVKTVTGCRHLPGRLGNSFRAIMSGNLSYMGSEH